MKKKMFVFVGIIVVIAIAAISIKTYANYKLNEKIENNQIELKNVGKKFSDEKVESKKLDILKKLESDKEFKALAKDEDFKEVSKKYNASINSMKGYFSQKYEKDVKSLTIETLASVTSKDEINAMKAKLITLKEEIKKNASYTLEKVELNKLEKGIDTLISSYDSRCMGIDEEIRIATEKAAEEARLKAEAEAKAKADAEAKAIADAAAKAKADAAKKSASTSTSNPSTSEHGRLVTTYYTVVNGQLDEKMWDIYSDGWHYVYAGSGQATAGWYSPDFFNP